MQFLVIVFFLIATSIYSQEVLKSIEEEYYDFLALQGITEHPAINYRTLSDSRWQIKPDAETGELPHYPWQNINLGTKRRLFGDVFLRIYGPELFNSVNTAVPYGQNDGVLWQGKGYNGSFTGGARLEGYGVELTFKPQLAFSQNLAFDLIKPNNMSSTIYTGKAGNYGYFWGVVDAPQRFGDKPFFVYDWGNSEIRYTWKTLTIGFGTQAIWLGPSYLNSILHSNNAPTYPKLDIGLRKQGVVIPKLNWYLGDIEFRIWTGYLSESKYFDNNSSNDHTMFHGFSFAYAPSFLPGLSLFVNRVCLVPWEWKNLKFIFPSGNNTIEDQKVSFGACYLLPQAGIEVYGELGLDDFASGTSSKGGIYISGMIRYPFHSMAYTVGIKKIINISPPKEIYSELIFEWNSMEMSQDFQFQWPYTWYFHSLIVHGYTNKGQWLGVGSGWGGSSQYLEFKVYYPQGSCSFFLHRNNPDNNFLYSQAVNASARTDDLERKYFKSFKANLTVGIATSYFLWKQLSISGGIAYNCIINPYYIFYKEDTLQEEYMHNFSIHLALKWVL